MEIWNSSESNIYMNLVITQAAATGLPVITTRHSGLPDQVLDGISGFLVAEGDYQALAEKIIYMIEHPDIWGSFGIAARAHIANTYNSKILLDEQIDWYQKILVTNPENS